MSFLNELIRIFRKDEVVCLDLSSEHCIRLKLSISIWGKSGFRDKVCRQVSRRVKKRTVDSRSNSEFTVRFQCNSDPKLWTKEITWKGPKAQDLKTVLCQNGKKGLRSELVEAIKTSIPDVIT